MDDDALCGIGASNSTLKKEACSEYEDPCLTLVERWPKLNLCWNSDLTVLQEI